MSHSRYFFTEKRVYLELLPFKITTNEFYKTISIVLLVVNEL